MKEIHLRIYKMTCLNCAQKITKILCNVEAIKSANVDFSAASAVISYDENLISTDEIIELICAAGYDASLFSAKKPLNIKNLLGIFLLCAAAFIIIRYSGLSFVFNSFPLAKSDMSYAFVFFIGLVTSVHCIAMCGGINLSQCLKPQKNGAKTFLPGALYNAGRIVSYTIVGGIVGAIGSVVNFDLAMKGIVQLIAGIFMIFMAFSMLEIFPSLRKFLPRPPKFLSEKTEKISKNASPFYVGLLNGLMPCGPLQAMQIYALSTGSIIKGALSMFLFSAGTVPLMFVLSATASFLSRKWTDKAMKIGAVLVLLLGLSMLSYGLKLSGLSAFLFPVKTPTDSVQAEVSDGVQIINSVLKSNKYPSIVVKENMPVRWIIDAPQGSINGCNNEMFIPEYNIRHEFKQGENIVEFIPQKKGRFLYTCWMGMISGVITVIGEGESEDMVVIDEDLSGQKPAYYLIPTGDSDIGRTKIEGDFQSIEVAIYAENMSPSVIIAKKGIELRIIIKNAAGVAPQNSSLLFPIYRARADLEIGENEIRLFPTESFEFSNGDSSVFAYVKIVEDVERVDIEAIKKEAALFETVVYPENFYSVRCH